MNLELFDFIFSYSSLSFPFSTRLENHQRSNVRYARSIISITVKIRSLTNRILIDPSFRLQVQTFQTQFSSQSFRSYPSQKYNFDLQNTAGLTRVLLNHRALYEHVYVDALATIDLATCVEARGCSISSSLVGSIHLIKVKSKVPPVSPRLNTITKAGSARTIRVCVQQRAERSSRGLEAAAEKPMNGFRSFQIS